MDRRKYIAALVEKTGVRLDEDDPIFAVVMLNQLILEDQKTELETLVGQLVKVGGAVRGQSFAKQPGRAGLLSWLPCLG